MVFFRVIVESSTGRLPRQNPDIQTHTRFTRGLRLASCQMLHHQSQPCKRTLALSTGSVLSLDELYVQLQSTARRAEVRLVLTHSI